MMTVSIMRPLEQRQATVAWLEISTSVGTFVIQPHHAPSIFALSPNKDIILCLDNGKQESITVNQGIIEITRTHTTIVLDE